MLPLSAVQVSEQAIHPGAPRRNSRSGRTLAPVVVRTRVQFTAAICSSLRARAAPTVTTRTAHNPGNTQRTYATLHLLRS